MTTFFHYVTIFLTSAVSRDCSLVSFFANYSTLLVIIFIIFSVLSLRHHGDSIISPSGNYLYSVGVLSQNGTPLVLVSSWAVLSSLSLVTQRDSQFWLYHQPRDCLLPSILTPCPHLNTAIYARFCHHSKPYHSLKITVARSAGYIFERSFFCFTHPIVMALL